MQFSLLSFIEIRDIGFVLLLYYLFQLSRGQMPDDFKLWLNHLHEMVICA